MKARWNCLIAGIILFASLSHAAQTYYVDPDGGNDNHPGTSTLEAWKTLDKAGSRVYEPGDSLLFKAGTRSAGMLIIRGGGTASSPVVIGSYGEGPMPAIDGNGAPNAVSVQDVDFCMIQNLEITNRSTDSRPHNGIHVSASRGGPVYGLTLRKLWIHHVSGHDERNGGSGIFVGADNNEKGQPSWYAGAVIEQNHLHDLPFNGIFLSGWTTKGRRPDGSLKAPSTGVVICGNLLYDIAGDGICIINTIGAMIEHNELHRGSTGQLRGAKTPSAGIWPHTSDDTIMRFNRVEGLRGNLDGQAFDVDINCRRTIVEHNLSRNNGTGFILLCSDAKDGFTQDTIIRENMSLDDAAEAPGALLTIVGAVEQTTFINNAFIITRTGSRCFLRGGDWTSAGTWPRNIRWEKNLIVTAGSLDWTPSQNTDLKLKGNLWQGEFPNTPKDDQGYYGDAGLVHTPVYQTLNTVFRSNSPAAALGFVSLNLKDAGLPHDSLWLKARDAASLRNPPGP